MAIGTHFAILLDAIKVKDAIFSQSHPGFAGYVGARFSAQVAQAMRIVKIPGTSP
ncbi:MAG: hypothetical protein ABSA45_06800 [Verrucomicrobiota bacterium]